ncbi:MAG: VWA domain-containing protein [Ignavibacteria bacterium]|nr:VWA domain-containing protein [Ignavibacteria bacterium]
MKRLLLLCLLLAAASVHAQPIINITKIVAGGWPAVELDFGMSCSSQPVYFTDRKYLRLMEDGVEIKDFTLFCPSPTVRSILTSALVLDASGNMSDSSNGAAKEDAHAFVNTLDRALDSVAVRWFNQHDTLLQNFTPDTALLHAAIAPLPAGGSAAALWDGVYAAVEAVYARKSRVSSCVIVLTNGVDNASTHTMAQCVALANMARIRIFAFGYGWNVQSAALTTMADLTGGRYYFNPGPGQIMAVYSEITPTIDIGYQGCQITYTSSCYDGSNRLVTLANTGFCQYSDTDSITYSARRDTTTFAPIRFGLSSAAVRGNSSATVALELRDALTAGDRLEAAEFRVLYDATKVHFDSLFVPAGSLFEGMAVTASPMLSGMRFRIPARKIVDSASQFGPLLGFVFKASDPEGTDTVACPLTLSHWVFDKGCFKPVLESGAILIAPRRPDMSASMDMPDSLTWVRAAKGYHPDPLIVSITVTNSGDREARNGRCRIIYTPKDLTPFPQQRDTIFLTPANIAPDGNASAEWRFTVVRWLVGDSIPICIEAAFDNAPTLRLCKKVWVPPSGAVLSCTVQSPVIKITADRIHQRYTPMPFDIPASVVNEGGKRTDSVYARITVPADLKLYGPDAPDRNTKRVLPAILNPGQQGAISWTLWHQPTPVDKEYAVRVCFFTANADSTCCDVRVIVPALEGPALVPQCTVPDSLHYIESADQYTPNPFIVRMRCVNRGGLPATNVGGRLVLPDGVVLADPSDSLQRYFAALMNPWKSGDTVREATWLVKYTKRLRVSNELQFRFVAGGQGPTGISVDSSDTYCTVRVPGLPPVLACELLLPDSLGMNAAKNDYAPNPFPATYRVRNIGKQDALLTKMEVEWAAGDDLALDPSTPRVKNVHIILAPGDTASATWLLRAGPRSTSRKAQLCASATDDQGSALRCCDTLPIPNFERSLACDAQTTESVIRYDSLARRYGTTQWVIAATITNAGGTAVSNVTAEIVLADSSLAPWVEFDPSYADNTNPKGYPAVFAKGSRAFRWGFRLRGDNRTGASVYPEFRIRYTAAGLPLYATGCSVPVEIEAVTPPQLVAVCTLPDTLRYDAASGGYLPSPFEASVTCVNAGSVSALNVSGVIAPPPGFILAVGETMMKNFTPSTLAPDTGGPAPRLRWMLRSVTPFPRDTCLSFRFNVAGTDSSTGATVQSMATCVLCVKGVPPAWQCALLALDSLVLNGAGNDVQPNPFTVRYRITNVSVSAGDIASITLALPGGSDLSFDAATPSTITGLWTLQPGDTLAVSWLLHVTNRLAPRTVRLSAAAFDALGNPTSCSRDVFIPAVTILNDAETPLVPASYALHQNLPNPFSSVTTIQFEVPTSQHVRLSIHDALGRQVAELVNDTREAGRHTVRFDAGALPSGTYLCRYEAGGVTMQRVMVLTR